MMLKVPEKIIYPELSYKITGLLMKAQNQLGRFCSEKQYSDCFEILLKEAGISYKREFNINFQVGLEVIKGNRVDFLIEDKILVEIKTVPFLKKQDYAQVMRYLKAGNIKLGLLANLRSEYLKPKRILNSSHH